MLVKIVNGSDEFVYQCTHAEMTHPLDKSGIEIEICNSSNPQRNKRFKIPDDGQAIYLMNDRGNTVDSYRWPPKE